MGELEDEQRHLDETTAAYDAAFRALAGRGRRSGIDDFANEALEAMRRERIRVYTEASGPLYFGRIDRADGETLYVGRHAVWSADNDLLIGQLARARRRAVLHRHRARPARDRAPPPARHRGAEGARLRRRAAARRRRGPPDRRDRRGHHPPAGRRDAPDHLDDHARPVRTDQPRRSRRAGDPGRPRDRQDRSRPPPRRVAALRQPRAHAGRRARRRAERDVHPLHRAGAARRSARAASSSGRSAR